MLKILKNKKAEGYIDIAVAVLVIAFVLVFVMSIWSMMTIKQDMIYMCEELLETATVSGRVDDEVYARYDELCQEVGFEPTVKFDASYFDSSKKQVQLGDVISCTLTHKVVLPGFGNFELPFEVTVTQSGLSRVYWK